MDRISEFPDALLLKILSLVPTKDVVATMVLSKRWQFLWRLVPRLEYSDDMYRYCQDGSFLRFVYSSLLLHEAPVLESLSLKLGQKSDSIDIGVCVKPAVSRCVRELNIEIDTSSTKTAIILPRSIFTDCRMLVTLKLNNAVLVDVSSPVCFPSLKNLSLLSIKYPCDELICKLLSGCPVLEGLVVKQCKGDNVAILAIRVASLKFLTHENKSTKGENHGLVLDAPCLEGLHIVDYADGFCVIENSMPKIVEAYLDVIYSNTQQLFGSLTSVKKLELCVMTSMDTYLEGTVFSRLEQLILCTCDTKWLDLLVRLLKDSPKLRFLKLEPSHAIESDAPCWNEPNQVPECVLSSLETLEWRKYKGTEAEKEVAKFILRNSGHLKIATFYPKSTDPVENLQMLMELSKSPRSSSTCQLVFHGNC